jgi:quercetin 2,3-dioxygenase
MITLRRSDERGRFDHGWLDTRHTFSFAGYYDPDHMGFRDLRVINEDLVAPGAGFPTHSHRDMEILTYVLEGQLEHRDSMGNRSVILPGEVQRMSAGTGVTHSEYNPSSTDRLHLLQIWIRPERAGLAPGYEQRAFAEADRRGRFRVLAAPDGREGALTIHQDAALLGALASPGDELRHELLPGRHAWLHVTRGEVALNGHRLGPGDAAAFSDESRVSLTARSDAELLLFDLA